MSTLPGEGDGDKPEEVEAVARGEDRNREDSLEATEARDDAGGQRRDVGRVSEDQVKVVGVQGTLSRDKEGM
jgi:hypothetical protein